MKQLIYSAPVRKLLLTSILILSDTLFFLFDDPRKLAPGLMIIGFLLTGGSVYLLFRIGAWIMKAMGLIREYRPLIVLSASLIFSLIIILQALGQLSFRDLAVIIPLAAVSYFYFTKTRSSNLQS